MRLGLSVGSTTDASSLADQVRRYKSRELKSEAREQEDRKRAVMKFPPHAKRGGRSVQDETLADLAIKTIVGHFAGHPVTEGLRTEDMRRITDALPVDVDPKITAVHVFDENYWKRCCISKFGWENCELIEHGLTWKQLYFEKLLQEKLEDFAPDGDRDELFDFLEACQDYIFTLTIRELRSHLDMSEVCSRLPNLTKLDLTYGVKKCGMEYVRMMFGMKISDANSLATCLALGGGPGTGVGGGILTSVVLTCNLIDDDLLRMLMTGLIKNDSITHLDVSHNKITNHGVRLLAKLLGGQSVLTALNLADNQIHAEGGRYLGRGLRSNDTLVDLNLRLNRLTDDGGRMLLEGLRTNQNLLRLNLAGNSLGNETVGALAAVLQEPECPLSTLDLSCNDLDTQDVITLESVLSENRIMTSIDLRMNPNVGEDAEEALDSINRMVHFNEIDARR